MLLLLLLLLLMGVHPSVLGGILLLLLLLLLGNAIAGSEPLPDAGTEERCAGRPMARGAAHAHAHRRSAAVRIRAGVLIQRLGHGLRRQTTGARMGGGGGSVGIPAVDGPVLRHGVLRRCVGPDGPPVLLLLTPNAGGALLLLLLLGGEVAVTTVRRRRWTAPRGGQLG